jgi:hypothetical protein
MFRNQGGQPGIAIVTVRADRRGQFHHLWPDEQVRPMNPAVGSWTD